mmetsp:Transcript_23621/g.37132  ORF Transcript_23621/g.37132 Transcript_23621/m.37132 type:complete len:147 (-) Transcript_23621:423-863(-)
MSLSSQNKGVISNQEKAGAKETLALYEKLLWGTLLSLFLSVVLLIITASSGAPIEAILAIAGLCGILSLMFSVLTTVISFHKKKYHLLDENNKDSPGSKENPTTTPSKAHLNPPTVSLNPTNPTLTVKSQNTPIDVVALDGTNEVV